MRHIDDAFVLRVGNRNVAWGEYGDPSGVPCLFFHGTPGSRTQVRPLHDKAVEHGVRLVAIERPGYGFSTPQRGRTVLDWTADVAAVTDHLSLDRFAVAGISGGGPHALACGYAFGTRVTVTLALSPGGPADLAPATRADVVRNRLAPVLDTVAAVALWRHRRGDFEAWFTKAFEGFAKKLPEADRALLRQPHVFPALIDDAFENTRHATRGESDDMIALQTPWGFRPEDVPGHVELWHGGLDTQVPFEVGKTLAARLPDCTPHFHPDGGHYVTLGHTDAILRSVTDSFAAASA